MYAALSYAKELDFSAVMTGDGGDELFFGYRHLFTHEQKEIENRMGDKIRRIKEKEPLVSETLGNYHRLFLRECRMMNSNKCQNQKR